MASNSAAVRGPRVSCVRTGAAAAASATAVNSHARKIRALLAGALLILFTGLVARRPEGAGLVTARRLDSNPLVTIRSSPVSRRASPARA